MSGDGPAEQRPGRHPEHLPERLPEPKPGDRLEWRLEERLGQIEQGVAYLTDLFRRRLLGDRERQQAAAAAQDQLDWARTRVDGQLLRPLLYDLILLLDRIGRDGHAGSPAASPDGTAEAAPAASPDGALVASVEEELLAVLAKNGVSRLPFAPGAFDPSCQEAVGTVPVADGAEHGQVARLVRHGYRHGEYLLRPQQVLVHTGT